MRLTTSTQVPAADIQKISFDLLICASGYEQRATFLAKSLNLSQFQHKIVFQFDNNIDILNRRLNDEFFSNAGFESIKADGDLEDAVLDTFKRIAFHKKGIRVLIDYSSMARSWYASILKHFAYFEHRYGAAELFFSYSPAIFSPSPKEIAYNIHVGPINGFSALTLPQHPTALILGLGYERSRANGLNEFLDGETFVFYTEGDREDPYAKEVERNNSELLSQIKPGNICRYSVGGLNDLYVQLLGLSKDLLSDFRIVIASCGPKVFTLISLLVSLKLKGIDVWRISAGKNAIVTDKVSSGELVVFKADFVSD